ncbi:regulatory protein, luxR family [Lishizhenia tianjinensis]|uniref:Regulatory protein, luxR family n=2 Tax=Lishizhenia tianjinensis TaxID=477690 RepID=A0A1I7BL41_9FLAO|nr:regulatory protein, luxR family [Lishizhenia tianjinensis]
MGKCGVDILSCLANTTAMRITLINKNELLCRGVASYVFDQYQILPKVVDDIHERAIETDLMIYCGRREDQDLNLDLNKLQFNVDVLALIRGAYFKPKEEEEFIGLGPIYPELIDGILVPLIKEVNASVHVLQKVKILYPTQREKEVLGLMAEGKLNKEIAELLNISIETVKTHRKNVKRKLGLKSQLDYIKYYKKMI